MAIQQGAQTQSSQLNARDWQRDIQDMLNLSQAARQVPGHPVPLHWRCHRSLLWRA